MTTDYTRLKQLAGVGINSTDMKLTESQKELELFERTYQGKNLSIDTEIVPLEQIQKHMEAATRALSIANQLRDPQEKRKHLSRVLSNMNTIRAALKHSIAQAEQEGWLK